MAAIDRRSRATGDVYRVRWHDRITRQREAEQFDDPGRAEQFRILVEMAGETMPPADQLRAFRFTELLPPETPETAPGVSVVAYCHTYIDQLIEPAPRQVADYRDMIRKHVAPFFGDMVLTDVTRATLREWQAWCEREGGHNGRPLSPNTVRRVRAALLHPTFTYATQRQDDGTPGPMTWNPFGGLKPPKKAKNPRPYTRTTNEAAMVIRAAYSLDEYTGDAVVMMLATGLRFGEMFGLARPAVVLDASMIEVRQVVAVGADVGARGGRGSYRLRPAPKSDDGWRTVPIPAPALPAFTRRVTAATGPHQLLLPGEEGGPASYTMWRKRWTRVQSAAIALGLPRGDLTTHGLRHGALSALGADGRVSAKALQLVAGHAHLSTSAGYLHEGNHPAVAAAMADWLGGALDQAA